MNTRDYRHQFETYLFLELVSMATFILHLHANFFQLLLGPSCHLVGCCSLPFMNIYDEVGKKQFFFNNLNLKFEIRH